MDRLLTYRLGCESCAQAYPLFHRCLTARCLPAGLLGGPKQAPVCCGLVPRAQESGEDQKFAVVRQLEVQLPFFALRCSPTKASNIGLTGAS